MYKSVRLLSCYDLEVEAFQASLKFPLPKTNTKCLVTSNSIYLKAKSDICWISFGVVNIYTLNALEALKAITKLKTKSWYLLRSFSRSELARKCYNTL